MRHSWPLTAALLLCLAASAIPAYVLLARVQPTDGVRLGHQEAVWGGQGLRDGRLFKPRAIAIDPNDHIYLVDKSARIQVFDADGNFLRGWKTPAWDNGKPTGLTWNPAGYLMVADTHYFRILAYTPDGRRLEDKTIGGQYGQQPGQFNWVTDVVQDSQGNYYISEYGECDRIQKFTSDGKFLLTWGYHGAQPGQFSRPQSLVMDPDDQLWVADSCNHRIQVFDCREEPPRLVKILGSPGTQPGELDYPYSILLDGQGHLYICEFGNHRVQKWNLQGEPLGVWGSVGRGPGQLYNPWAIAQDSKGRLFVVDCYNHRVFRIRL